MLLFSVTSVAATGSAGEVTVSDYLRQSRMTILTVDECRLLYGDDIVVSQICINSGSASACSVCTRVHILSNNTVYFLLSGEF